MPDATTPYNLQDWLLRTPVVPVRRRDTYIELPAFAYTGLEWKGASEVISQFNFSASRKFTLSNLPTKPTDVNYGLCIRYRIGDTVYRFKLWDDPEFKLTGDVPVYSNQIIRANFVLEVWSYEGETVATNVAAIQMITSVKILPTDVSQLGVSAALAVGAEFRELENVQASVTSLPTSGLVGHYNPASVTEVLGSVSAWTNLVSGWPTLASAGVDQPTYSPVGLTVDNDNAVSFNGGSNYLEPAAINVVGPFTIYLYAATLVNLFPGTLLELNGPSGLVAILNYSALNTLQLSRGGAAVAEGYWPAEVPQEPGNARIIKVVHESSQLTLQIGNEAPVVADVSFERVSIDNVRMARNEVGSGGYASFSIYEMIVYQGLVSEETDAAVKAYITNYYLGAQDIQLPLVFNTGVQWLDNAD